MSKKVSYVSADAFPIKVLLLPDLIESIREKKKILPVHIQISPTNTCTGQCPWCSCANVNRKLSLTAHEMMNVLVTGASVGCRAVTYTGGGEPLMHPTLEWVTACAERLTLKQSLTTNGHFLDPRDAALLRRFTWIRVSLGDGVPMSDLQWRLLERSIEVAPEVDWNFSYVVASDSPDLETINKLLHFAEAHNFTHVRIVADIFNAEKITLPKIDHPLAILQPRREPPKGTEKCWTSLLKPYLASDGYWYPCCGVQYATNPPSRDMTPEFRMSEWQGYKGLQEIVKKQEPFDGSICEVCYYSQYNRLLETLLEGVKHVEFV